MRLTIYSKPGCHLCNEMKAVVHRLIASAGHSSAITIEEVDISDDGELLERYGLEIPVLLIDGVKAAKFRVSDEQLRRMVSGRDSKEL